MKFKKLLRFFYTPKKCKTLIYSMVNPGEIFIEDEEIIEQFFDYLPFMGKVYLYKFNIWVAESDVYMVQVGNVFPARIINGKIYKK